MRNKENESQTINTQRIDKYGLEWDVQRMVIPTVAKRHHFDDWKVA